MRDAARRREGPGAAHFRGGMGGRPAPLGLAYALGFLPAAHRIRMHSPKLRPRLADRESSPQEGPADVAHHRRHGRQQVGLFPGVLLRNCSHEDPGLSLSVQRRSIWIYLKVHYFLESILPFTIRLLAKGFGPWFWSLDQSPLLTYTTLHEGPAAARAAACTSGSSQLSGT